MVMKRSMVAFLTQLLFALRSRFTRRVRLEAENLLLRQQLIVLRRRHPGCVRLWNLDRLMMVWMARCRAPSGTNSRRRLLRPWWNWPSNSPSSTRANWPPGSLTSQRYFVSEASVYRRLRALKSA